MADRPKVRRRLTTIMCADVASYARLMEADETATLATLNDYREAMAGLIARHEGRIVNTWGDAVIAEFTSVVEAVQCAIDVQRELATRNGALPSGRRMLFRIGINLGDVMVDGDDIYGEGVNVAARLQEVAEPGGIAISRAVHDQVRHKLTISFDFLGEQSVKNVSEPVSSYRVVLDRRNQPTLDPHWSQSERPGPAAAPEPVAQEPVAHPADPLVDWHDLKALFLSLPRPLQIALGLVGFLFLINLMSGIGSVWFHWPSMPILFITAMYLLMRRGRRSGSPADKA